MYKSQGLLSSPSGTGPGLVGGGGGLDGLLGVARERHGQDERAGPDVVRRHVALHQGDGHRHERGGDRGEYVAYEATVPHPQDDHVLDVVMGG